jgi:NADH dehydrogenase FAD-containing subunit
MGKNLVFVGGGHAHLTALINLRDYLEKGHDVTLVSPIERHYYSGMGPGMLSGIYGPHEIRFDLKKLAQDRGANFVQTKVKEVDPENQILKLEEGPDLSYDVVSFNTGSYVPMDLVEGTQEGVYPVKPIVNLLKAKKAILSMVAEKTPNLVIIGGGAAGLELSGNMERLVSGANGKANIKLVAGSRLMQDFPEKVRELALASLSKRGVEVIEGPRAQKVKEGKVHLEDGKSLEYDLVFPAIGVRSYPIFERSNLKTGPDGAMVVTRRLNSVDYSNIFGGGDCISLEDKKIDRVGVYAVRQNPILHKNLMAALEEKGEMERFEPQEHYMLIFNLGDGSGIFVRDSWVWNGRLAFILKNYIDQRFMKKFQVSGERQDRTDYLEE